MNHLTIQFWKFLTNKSFFFFLYEKIRMEIQFEIHGMIYERKFLFFFFFLVNHFLEIFNEYIFLEFFFKEVIKFEIH